MSETKTCRHCGVLKPRSGFPQRSNMSDGLYSWCRSCCAEMSKQRRRDHPQYEKNLKLKKNYGISIEQYEALAAAQAGLCAICGKPESQRNQHRLKRLAVDHDHKTGRIRGLLCAHCNVALGYLEDDTNRMSAMIAYVEAKRDPPSA